MKIFLTTIILLSHSFLFCQNEYFIKVENQSGVDLSYPSFIASQQHPLKSFIYQFEIENIDAPFNTKDVNLQNIYVFKASEVYTFQELNQYLKQYTFIEYIEEVPQYELFYTPNDPLYTQQYALSRIEADLAWDISTCQGNSNVVLAITDDAVRVDHEDIINALWSNPNEIPNNGIDDDNNGYVDDVIGWDAADNDNDPSPPANATNSYFSHGTHVAGIAGASTDNNVGIASSGFGVQIMPVKIGANANGSLIGAYSGVDYAISCGYVDVVNMSWGGGSYSQTYQYLFDAGHNLGITFVAAAGNSNTSTPMYPAAYNHVISVAATDQNDVRASFSNYGATVDVSAPGVNILSTVAGATNAYDYKSGTSMASPLVAGLCGLMKCYNNGITPDEIETCLKSTADNIDSQNSSFINQLGAGRVNARLALQCLSTTPIAQFSTSDTIICPNQQIQFFDESAGATPLTWNWQFPGGTPATSTQQNPQVSYTTNGIYSVTLTVSNAFGNDILTKTNYIVVEDPTAILSGNATINNGGLGFLKVDFTGTPPYDFIYTDGINNFTETGITQNPYYIAVSPSQSTNYTLVSMNDAYCNGLVSGSAQVNIIGVDVEEEINCYFTKIYGDNQSNIINDVYFDNINKFYYACGQHGTQGLVVKLNEEGSIIWSKSYSGVTKFWGIELLEDLSGLLLVTDNDGVGSDIQITRINTDGLVIWSKNYDSGFTDRLIPRKASKTLLYPNDIINNAYNLLFATGPVYPYDHATVASFNINTGSIITANKWSNNSGTGATSENAPYNYIYDNDGNVAFVAPYTDLGDGGNFTRINPINNNLIASIRFEGSSDDSRLYKVAQLNNGNYVIGGIHRFGSSSYYPFLACIDKVTNNVLWIRRIQEVLSFNNFDLTIGLNDIYVIINGSILVKLDNNGNLITSKQIANASDAKIEYDEGLLNIVDNNSYSQGFGSTDFLMAVLDTSLNNCLLSNYTVNVTNETINTNSVSKDVISLTFNESNIIHNITNLTYSDTSICQSICDTVITTPTQCTNLFQKYFDDNGVTERINVEYTSDGGYIVTGATTAYGQGSYDVFAAKFDDNDNLVWSNTYGTAINGSNTGNELSYSTPVVEMDNGDFVFGCESNTYGTRSNVGMIVVFRTDALGNILWQKTIGLNQDYSHVSKMIKDGDDVVLVGSAGGSLTSGGLDDAYILKLDVNGNTLFSNVLTGNSNDHFTDVLKIGSTYYCFGSSLSFSSTRNPYLATFDLNGNLLWSKYYTGLTSKLDVKSILVNNELIILSGANSNTFNLFKIDLQGNVLGQSKNLLTSGSADINFALEIENIDNGSFIVSGYSDTQNSNNFDLFASKIDTNFNESWTKLIGGAGDESVYFRDNNLSLDLPNNTGLIAGYTTGYGNSDKDLYLAKFSLDTTVDCENIYLDYFNEVSTTVVANNYSWSVEQLPSLINANFIQATMPLQDSIICEVLCENSTGNIGANCSDKFQKYFDDNGITRKVGMINTADGGYLIGGSTTAYGQGSYDIFIAKHDSNDNLEWSNTYGTAVNGTNSGSELSYTTTLVEMDNGDIVVGCESNTYGTRPLSGNIVVLRLSSSGNVIWQKKLNSNIDYSHSRKIIKDGNDVVVVGSAGGSLTIGGLDDAYIMKIDGNSGSVIFDNVLYGSAQDHFHDIIKNGNNFYVTGTSNSISSYRRQFVTQFTLSGIVNWTKYLNLNDNFSFSKLDFNSQDEIYILSIDNTAQDVYLSKYDNQMNLIGTVKKLNSQGTSAQNLISDIEVLNDGSILISGATKGNFSNNLDLFVSKFDSSLNEIWTKIIGGNNDDVIENGDYNMAISDNQNFVRLVGTTESYGNLSQNLFFSTISLDTITSCETFYQNYWTETLVNSQTLNHSFDTSFMPGLINANFIQATMPLQETVICEVLCEDSTVVIPTICINTNIDTVVCYGDSIQLNAGIGTNYSWQENYNISNVLIQNPIVWPEVDTTYIVYYEDDSCQYFDTVHVVVATLDVDASPEDTAIICTVDDLQLNANGADSYIWSPSVGLNNANISNPIFSGNSNTELIVEGQNLLGCSDFDTVYVEVLPCCGAYADFEASDTIICLGDSILFTNTSISGNNASFIWDFGINATPNSFNGAQPTWINFNNPGAYNVALILTDDCGIDTANLTIYVNDLPPTNIANDTAVCGLDTLFYELGDIEIAGNNYTWTPTLGLDNPNIANPIASVTDSATYIVIIEDFFTGCSNTDSVTIKITSEPDTIIQLVESSICIGDFATVFVDLTNKDSIIWQNQIINTDSLNLPILNDTLIYVDVFINDCKFSDSLLITADTLVDVNLSFNDSICFGEWDTIQVNTIGAPVWNTGDTSYNFPVQILSDTIFIVAAYNGFCANYDTANLYVYDLPVSDISGNDTVCINSDEVFTITNGFTYLWSNGSNLNSTNYVIEKDTLITVEVSNLNCTIIDSHYVYIVDSSEIEILGDLNYCENESYLLYVNTTNNVIWSTGSTNDTIQGVVNNNFLIDVEVNNVYCPRAYDTVEIIMDSIPVIHIESPMEFYENELHQVIVEGVADAWSWTPPYGLSCVNCQNPIIDIDSNMVYVLTAENNGCFAYDTLKVNVLNLENCLLLPTAFSPNNDGLNDNFYAVVSDDKTTINSFKIYNRWGELIHDNTEPWDGTYKGEAQNIDVYIFIIVYSCNGEDKVLSGNVTLLR